AADADLDAAWALALAHGRWPEAGYDRAAADVAAAIDAHEVTVAGEHTVMAAGPWARGEPVVFNPSYPSPVADDVLAAAGIGDPAALERRGAGHRAVISAQIAAGGTPTDWLHLFADGSIEGVLAPDRSEP